MPALPTIVFSHIVDDFSLLLLFRALQRHPFQLVIVYVQHFCPFSMDSIRVWGFFCSFIQRFIEFGCCWWFFVSFIFIWAIFQVHVFSFGIFISHKQNNFFPTEKRSNGKKKNKTLKQNKLKVIFFRRSFRMETQEA